ncbi:MAG: hypothetical protein WC495_02630 [Patescibacteria group bacterium]
MGKCGLGKSKTDTVLHEGDGVTTGRNSKTIVELGNDVIQWYLQATILF